jgi:hypothetical protein
VTRATAVEKYLQNYAEAETGVIAPPLPSYRYVLTIPAYQESGILLDQLENLLTLNRGVLIILVINRPTPAIPTGMPDVPGPADTELARIIRQRYRRTLGADNSEYFDIGNSNTLLMIDRYTAGRGIPLQQGVGLARKIAADIACCLIHRGTIKSPWIHSSDADVCWPASYFDVTAKVSPDASALLYPFRHRTPAGGAGLAVQLYEFSLRYYVAGLHWAGSPWAVHTVGSTLAIHYQHYAKVRGFPRRSAGEDFYILNKLAKTGPVVSLAKPCLLVADRPSDRVPFGTGPACSKIVALAEPFEDYQYYHPQCFAQLRKALDLMRQLAVIDAPLQSWQTQLKIGPIPPFVRQLQDMGLGAAIEHASRQGRNPSQFSRQITIWFDAFRTLKFVHGIRDHYHPSSSLRTLLPQSDFLSPLLGGNAAQLPRETAGQVAVLEAFNQRLLKGGSACSY